MSLLVVKGLNFSYTDADIYRSVDFALQQGDHATLVGPNGSGKSTFMKLIAKKLTPDSGTIEWMPGIRYAYLDQQLEVEKDQSISSYLYGAYHDLFNQEKKMNEIYEEAAKENDITQERLLLRAEAIRENLELNNFYQVETEINNVVMGLGLGSLDLSLSLSRLSGGEKAKVYLAKILLEKPDVILMDEPTNFLDKVHIDWLEGYLNTFKGSFIIISHDQEFLRAVSGVVYAFENHNLVRYKGNYDYYLSQKDLRFEQERKNYEKQQEYIKRTEIFIKKNLTRASTTKRAQSKRTQLSKIDVLDKPTVQHSVYINFPFSKNLGTRTLIIKNLEIGYDGKPLLEPLSYELLNNERVEIVGKNGVGKTTLVKTLLGMIPSISGSFIFGPSVEINYFSQEEDIDLSKNAVDYIHSYYPDMEKNKVMSTLAPLGVRGDLAMKPLSELSGGELERVRLSLMTLKKSNFLILDEPTNHLDKLTKVALHQAIDSFPGAVMIVSHEKGFADDLVDYVIKF